VKDAEKVPEMRYVIDAEPLAVIDNCCDAEGVGGGVTVIEIVRLRECVILSVTSNDVVTVLDGEGVGGGVTVSVTVEVSDSVCVSHHVRLGVACCVLLFGFVSVKESE
jgi:hypothetical protein